MARKIVAIHGIGNAQPGWSENLRLELGIPKVDWIEFCYDDLMDRSLFNRLTVMATRLYLGQSGYLPFIPLATGLEDYLNDIITYFLMRSSRLKIQVRLKTVLAQNPDAMLLAHSLGSVVAYETLQNFSLSAFALLTLGSPLSKEIVQRCLRVPEKCRPLVTHWFNVWSPYDPISGPIDELGCAPQDQYAIKCSHDLWKYTASQKKRILALYEAGDPSIATSSQI
jgi:hypothetical protein